MMYREGVILENYQKYIPKDWEKHIEKLNTGIHMAYYECGKKDGIPLLLIHGVTDGCVSWMQMAPKLAERGYHCYIVEYRGNGATDKPDQGKTGYTAELLADDIMALMDSIGLEKTHVAGHSYGTLISQVLAARYPERFFSYTLIDAAVNCTENPVLKWAVNGEENGFNGVEAYDDFMPADFVKDWTATGNEIEDFRKAAYAHAAGLPAVAWKNLMRGLTDFNSSSFIGDIKGDVLVIWGTEDDIFTADDQKDLKEGLTSCNVRYVDIEGASPNGYWDSLEMAEKYADHIDRFIKQII